MGFERITRRRCYKEGRFFLGSPQILICGESESTAKIHMSDIVANRIEPSLARVVPRGIEPLLQE